MITGIAAASFWDRTISRYHWSTHIQIKQIINIGLELAHDSFGASEL